MRAGASCSDNGNESDLSNRLFTRYRLCSLFPLSAIATVVASTLPAVRWFERGLHLRHAQRRSRKRVKVCQSIGDAKLDSVSPSSANCLKAGQLALKQIVHSLDDLVQAFQVTFTCASDLCDASRASKFGPQ